MSLPENKIPPSLLKKIFTWLEDTPSPNEGRVKELKDAIKKGRYPSKKAIRGAADGLFLRFRGKGSLL